MKKQALITGGGTWIGRAIALRLAAEDYHVHVIGRTSATLKETCQLITEQGGDAQYACVDISSQAAIAEYSQQWQGCDALIHSAAIYPAESLSTISSDSWSTVINNNLNSGYYLVSTFLDALKQSLQGNIIFISSICGGEVGVENLAHYGASKAGLEGFMRTAAVELAQYHIRVNAISPGNFINTNRFELPEADLLAMRQSIPLGRTGRPDDIAGVARFLLSEDAAFITGQTIVVDGGQTIHV